MASFAASIVLAAVVTSSAAFFVPWEQAATTPPFSPACIADDPDLMLAIGAMTREKALNDAALADPEYVERHLRGTREQLAEMSRHQQVVLSYFANEAKACLR